jgi:hypothetical protein
MTIRAESIPEPVRPLHVRACVWCEKDEMYVPLQDCLSCQHNRQDQKNVWCSWGPAEKPCEGCGIPAGLCEPETCQILQAIKKAAM